MMSESDNSAAAVAARNISKKTAELSIMIPKKKLVKCESAKVNKMAAHHVVTTLLRTSFGK
jgi:hypothetical protein